MRRRQIKSPINKMKKHEKFQAYFLFNFITAYVSLIIYRTVAIVSGVAWWKVMVVPSLSAALCMASPSWNVCHVVVWQLEWCEGYGTSCRKQVRARQESQRPQNTFPCVCFCVSLCVRDGDEGVSYIPGVFSQGVTACLDLARIRRLCLPDWRLWPRASEATHGRGERRCVVLQVDRRRDNSRSGW